MAILGVLLDPKQPIIRATLWVGFAISLILICTDLGWVKSREWEVSLSGILPTPYRISPFRLSLAGLAIAFAVLALAVRTWPPHPRASGPKFLPTLTVPMQIPSQPLVNTAKAPIFPQELQPPPSVKILPEKKPTPKPPLSSHPIIVESGSQVTQDSTTNEIKITLNLMNTSSVGANVHLVSDLTWNGEPIPGSIDTRDVAMAPSPYIFTLHISTTPSPLGLPAFMDGTAKIAVILNASYPDENGITVYKYEGDVVPKGTSLNDVNSVWTKDDSKK